MTEEESYLAAMEELKAGTPIKAIWIKAIAHSNGDENSAKAKYLLFRAEQIRTDALKGRLADVVQQSSAVGKKGARIILRVAVCIGALIPIYPAFLAIGVGIDLFRDAHPIAGILGVVFGVALLVFSGCVLVRCGPSSKSLG